MFNSKYKISPGTRHFGLLKLLSIVIKVLPGKIIVIRALGTVLGLYTYLRQGAAFRAAVRLGAATFRPQQNTVLFILQYLSHYGTCFLWNELFYDLKKYLLPYLNVSEIIEHKQEFSQGAIFVGIHYGTFNVLHWIIARHEIHNCVLAGSAFYRNYISMTQSAWPPVLTKKPLFFRKLRETGRLFISNAEELFLVRFLRKGGTVTIANDLAMSDSSTGHLIHNLLPFPVQMSYFPFKLALQEKVPLFFIYFDITANGSYIAKVIKITHFTTPQEGLETLAHLFSKQLQKNPFLWLLMPTIFSQCTTKLTPE